MANRKFILVIGKHRTFDLAERHRKQLIRQYSKDKKKADVRITARRTSTGQFSKRGHFFTFRIEILKKEFLLSFSFSRGKANRNLHVEAVVTAYNMDEVERQIMTRRFDREHFVFVEWSHGRGQKRKSKDWHDFEKFVSIAETIAAENRRD